MQGKQPSKGESRTWHVHDDETWDWGATCLVCMADIPQAGNMPNFNIKRLKEDNAGHYTQNEMRKEIYESAREDGRDITKS